MGDPTGKARPRVTKNAVYTPLKTKNYQQLVRLTYYGPHFKDKMVEVKMKLFYPAPGETKLKKAELVKFLKKAGFSTEGLKAELWKRCCDYELIPAAVKPDLDNVEKSILDALNKVAYRDDGQVVKLSSEKYRSSNPRAEVQIKEFEV